MCSGLEVTVLKRLVQILLGRLYDPSDGFAGARTLLQELVVASKDSIESKGKRG